MLMLTLTLTLTMTLTLPPLLPFSPQLQLSPPSVSDASTTLPLAASHKAVPAAPTPSLVSGPPSFPSPTVPFRLLSGAAAVSPPATDALQNAAPNQKPASQRHRSLVKGRAHGGTIGGIRRSVSVAASASQRQRRSVSGLLQRGQRTGEQ
jgi:hypothetical protein